MPLPVYANLCTDLLIAVLLMGIVVFQQLVDSAPLLALQQASCLLVRSTSSWSFLQSEHQCTFGIKISKRVLTKDRDLCYLACTRKVRTLFDAAAR